MGTRGMESAEAVLASPESIALLPHPPSRTKSGDVRNQRANGSEQGIPWIKLLGSLDRSSSSLQSALRDGLSQSILNGRIPPGTRLPSTRVLASQLGIARITVSMAYDAMELEGLVVVRQRSGHYVARRLWPEQITAPDEPSKIGVKPKWTSYFLPLPRGEKRLERPRQWQKYRFPFVYGQADQERFPLADWRECSRLAQAKLPSDYGTLSHASCE